MKSSGRLSFSIAQLALVLAVMTVGASLAIPSFFAREEITLPHAARLLARDLRDVQDRATFQHRSLHIRFDPAGDGYEAVTPEGDPIEAPLGPGPFVRRYSADAVFRGVRIVEFDLGPEAELAFDANGLLRHPARFVLEFGNERTTVRIASRTGEITIDGEPHPPH